MSREIRISSGWGFAESFDSEEFQQLSDMADGLELSITSEDRFAYICDAELEMETASIHLQSPPETTLEWYYELVKEYPIETIVVHATEDREALESIVESVESPPLTIENLDRNSENRDKALSLAKKLYLSFTIDIQHLVETKTNAECQAMIDELAPKIEQFHISGFDEESEYNHELTVNANNRGKLVPLLEYISTHHEVDTVPWVIEGRYTTVEEVEDELSYLREFGGED